MRYPISRIKSILGPDRDHDNDLGHSEPPFLHYWLISYDFIFYLK